MNQALTENKLEALYIKDMDIFSTSEDNMDLTLYYGPKQISRALGIPLDNHWNVTIDPGDFSDSGFITLPYEAAMENPDKPAAFLGCWIGLIFR